MNPVLRKDLLALLRLRRTAAIQVAFVAALAGLVLLSWPQAGVVTLASRGHDQLLIGLVVGQLVLLTLVIPGLAGVALSGEREAATLEMLYASRLSPLQIIIGKVLSAVSFPILLLVSGLPFVAMLQWRGDVDLGKLAWCYLVLTLSAVLLAMLSLTLSAISKQSATALVLAYVTVLALGGGLLVPAAIMLESQSGLLAAVLHYARALSPIAAAMSVLRPELNHFGGRQGLDLSSPIAPPPTAAPGFDDPADPFGGLFAVPLLPLHGVFVVAATLVIAGCAIVLVRRLSRPPTTPESFAAAPDEHRSLGRRVMYLIDDKKPRRPMSGFNPVITKESRTNQLRGGRWMIRTLYGSFVLAMLLAVMSLYGGAEHADLLAYVAQVLTAFQIGLIALVVPSLTSPSVSGEIEGGTFDMLRLSLVGGGRIFWGKFLPAFAPAILPVLAMLPAFATVCFVDPGYLPRFVRLVPVVALAVALCCTLGLTVSTLLSSTARATIVSYMLVATLVVLPALAMTAGGSQLSPSLAAWMAMPSPLAMALALVRDDPTSLALQRLWTVHLYTTAGMCLVLLLIARVRLTALLRQG